MHEYNIGKDEFLGTCNSMVENQNGGNGDILDGSPENDIDNLETYSWVDT